VLLAAKVAQGQQVTQLEQEVAFQMAHLMAETQAAKVVLIHKTTEVQEAAEPVVT